MASTIAAAGTAAAERGAGDCISYSYEPGSMTTTVYYHNRCDVTRKLTIYRASNSPCDDGKIELHVAGGKKDNEVVRCGDVTQVVAE
ncbi:hypothetical protein [Nocardia callitridis]|uniref:hypothetical protein n=1 Tax=Nocardia callitridis TaxID=648753 RepID=UPI0031EE46EF